MNDHDGYRVDWKGAGVTGVPILVEQWPGHGELTNNHPLFMRQLRRFIYAAVAVLSLATVYRKRDTCSITSILDGRRKLPRDVCFS